MRTKVAKIAVMAFALIVGFGYTMPEASFAEDMKSPTATNVKYEKDKDGKNTAIKSFTIEPYTYLNIEPGKMVKLDDGKLREIAAKEIFPRWSVIANEVLRDQADQLVTIEGSGMMDKDKTKDNSFDKHFNTNNTSVSGAYSKYDWSVDNLAEKLALSESKHVGETEDDEMRATGITAIGNLSGARTLMGQELRNCSNDNDNTVDDFLGNGVDKTKSDYRLKPLEDASKGSGFASIVTCVNRHGDTSANYDYVTMGLAVYDFDLSPIAANDLKYVEAADKLENGEDILMGKMGNIDVHGIKFYDTDREATYTYLKNTTPNKSVHTSALKNTKTEEHSITSQETSQWSMTQSVGVTINAPTVSPTNGTGIIPRVSWTINHSWSELWSTMKGKTEKKSEGNDKSISSQLELPPYTVAKITQNVNDKLTQEDYQQPMVLNYKVAIFAMSGDYYNGGSTGGISSSLYDKQWMSVIFDGSDAAEVTGNDALGSLYNRAVLNKDTPGYDEAKGKLSTWCDKGAWKKSTKIDWNSIAKEIADESRGNYDITSSKTGKKSTLENLASELPLLERASNLKTTQVNMSASLDQIVAYYPLKSVALKKDARTFNTKPNSTFYLDGLELQGLNEKNADFYGFTKKWGEWKIYDAYGKTVIEDNSIADEDKAEGRIQKGNFTLVNDKNLNSQYVSVDHSAVIGKDVYLKWVIDPSDNTKITDNTTLTTEGRDKPYMTLEEKAKVSTPVIQLKIDDKSSDAASVKVSGSYSGNYSDKVNLGEKLTAKVYDATGKIRGFPIYWEDDGDVGIAVSENGDVEFSTDGTYRVRAFTYPYESTDKIYSDWVEIKAKKPATLTKIEMRNPEFEDEDLLITKKHPSREFDLNEYISFYDQYGDTYGSYYDNERENGKKWVTRDLPKIEFSLDDEEGAYADNNGILHVYEPGTYVISARAYETADDGTREYLTYDINDIKIKVTREDWLESIDLEYPSVKPTDLILKGENDAVVIKDIASQLRFYDQSGDPWDGKKPTVLFDVNGQRNQAQMRNGDLYIYEPGNYTLYAMADGFDINTVDIQVTGNEELLITTSDPSVLKITDQDPEPAIDLSQFVEYRTTYGSRWKGDCPAVDFTLDKDVEGARIENRTESTGASGEYTSYPALVVTQPGEYRVHVKAKKVSEYSDAIEDIIVKADEFKTVSYVYLKLPEGSKGSFEEVIDTYSDNPSASFDMKAYLAYKDKDGEELDPQTSRIKFPEVSYGFYGEAPSEDEAVIDNGVLTAYKPGTYVVSVEPTTKGVEGGHAVIEVKDITSVHNFGDWELTDPICKDTVNRAKTCEGHDTDGDRTVDEECEVSINQVVPGAGEHQWSTGYEEEDGDYIKGEGADEYTLVSGEAEEGVTLYKKAVIKCAECGRAVREDASVYYPKDYTFENTEPATCTKTGKYEILDGENVVGKGDIPVAGHDYVYTVTKEASCTEEGVEELVCSRCKDVKAGAKISIPRLNHDKSGGKREEAATCTEDGHVYYTCKFCKKEHLGEVIPATGHTWDKGKVTKKATADAAGIMTYTCTVCKATKTTEIAKIEKKANPLKIKGKKATVKNSKLKKKAQKLKVTKVIKFTKKGEGKLTYTKISGNKKIKINKKTGKVTVKKGLKKGTYKVKVKVKAAGNEDYKANTVNVTIKVRVK